MIFCYNYNDGNQRVGYLKLVHLSNPGRATNKGMNECMEKKLLPPCRDFRCPQVPLSYNQYTPDPSPYYKFNKTNDRNASSVQERRTKSIKTGGVG
jgi:hypothetical protein